MNIGELFVAVAVSVGFLYGIFRWYIDDDDGLNSELFP